MQIMQHLPGWPDNTWSAPVPACNKLVVQPTPCLCPDKPALQQHHNPKHLVLTPSQHGAFICFLCTCIPLFFVLQEPELHLRKPALFAKCLQLLYCIAEPPLTCEAVFSLLQPSNETYGQLLPQLGSILVEPLPGSEESCFVCFQEGGSDSNTNQPVRFVLLV
jgi:hypothetical protein